MVTVKMTGGLGNQMFIYAFGRSLSLKRKEELQYDLSWYAEHHSVEKGAIARQFVLDRYNIAGQPAAAVDAKSYKSSLIVGLIEKVRSRIQYDYHYHFHPGLMKGKKQFFTGFFHSHKYFSDCAETIKSDLTLKDPLTGLAAEIEAKIKSCEAVSMHIRRDDLITSKKSNQIYGVLPQSYYDDAVALVKTKCANPVFFIFTDDVEWAKTSLKLEGEKVFVSGNGFHETIDLHLMSLCKINIIANSTFSWWAAWLNRNQDRIVIYPNKWFRLDGLKVTSDFIPEGWLGI